MIIKLKKHMHGAWILALAMVLSFIVPPVINLIRLIRQRADAVAIVNGLPVTSAEFRQSVLVYDAYIRSLKMMGLEKFVRKSSKQDILESCVSKVLKQELARNLSIEAQDKELAMQLAKEIGQKHVVNGVLDKERYSADIFASTGMRMSEFENRVREDMAGDALDDICRISSPEYFSVPEAQAQKRFFIINFDYESVKAELERAGVDKKDILEFYNNNQGTYLSPEERVFQAVLLKNDLFKDQVLVTDDEIFEHYQSTVASSFTKPAQYAIDVWESSIEDLQPEELKEIEQKLQGIRDSLANTGVLSLAKNTLKDIEVYSKDLGEPVKMGLNPILAAALLDLKSTGGLTPVLKSEKKIFFARVTDYKEPFVIPLEEAKEAFLPVLEKRALVVLARQEVEELIKEARENGNGSEVLARESEKFGLETQKFFVQPEGLCENDDFKNSTEVETDLLGAVAKEDGYLVYTLLSFKPREVLPIDEVLAEVQSDFLTHAADKKVKSLVSQIKQDILSKNISTDQYKEVAGQWRGTVEKTDWVARGEKVEGLEDYQLNKAFRMTQVGNEVLIVEAKDSVKIVTLFDTRTLEAKPVTHDPLSYDSQRDSAFGEGLLASGARSARVKYVGAGDRAMELVEEF